MHELIRREYRRLNECRNQFEEMRLGFKSAPGRTRSSPWPSAEPHRAVEAVSLPGRGDRNRDSRPVAAFGRAGKRTADRSLAVLVAGSAIFILFTCVPPGKLSIAGQRNVYFAARIEIQRQGYRTDDP
jgi:hypothetical protein